MSINIAALPALKPIWGHVPPRRRTSNVVRALAAMDPSRATDMQTLAKLRIHLIVLEGDDSVFPNDGDPSLPTRLLIIFVIWVALVFFLANLFTPRWR